MPVSFNDQELAEVMRYARLFDPSQRDRFLRSIASRLDGVPVTKSNLNDALLFVASVMGLSAPPFDAEPPTPTKSVPQDLAQQAKETHNGFHHTIPFARRRLQHQR